MKWILSAALTVSLIGCGGSDDSGPLKVGCILPMSGAQSTYGEESWNGMQLAMEDLKKQGTEWTLILKDEKSQKQDAGNHAKTLTENEGAHVLIGSVASSNTKQIALVAKEAGVPLITPASTNDKLTRDGGPMVSRICFADSWQGAVLANFSASQGWKNAVAVVDKAQVYSTGLAANFQKVFEQKGGKVSYEYYTTEDTDFSNTIQNVANRKPDVIFISGYYAQGGPMIRQAKGKWSGIPVIAGDGLDSPDLVGLVGDTKTEIYMSSHFAADAPDPRVQDFAKRYKERFNKPPGAMAALGYDVLFVLADAVKRCEDPKDPDALAKAIAETKGVACITGMIDLTTEDRTPVKDAVIVKVEGGLKYHATIKAD
ncbi:MAG: ABC transporter substrate-binding protein [Planctomycetota bacterium]|nr:ABC transporter substrate-binding protein [Planctomycetota bacterium]